MNTKNNFNSILFEKADHRHLKDIFQWLSEPHMIEFWDNSQEHKDDIINFVNGRIEPSNYFNGIFTYWIGMIDMIPFSFILTCKMNPDEESSQIHKDNLSKTGTTYGIDFCIGNINFLGKGLASKTLSAFTEFFQSEVDPQADTFFIDPSANNPRAKHVYANAGFKLVGNFKSEGGYWDFNSEETHLMVKNISANKQ